MSYVLDCVDDVENSVEVQQPLSQLQVSHERLRKEYVSRGTLVYRLEHELDRALAFRRHMEPLIKTKLSFNVNDSIIFKVLYLLDDLNWSWNWNFNWHMNLSLYMNWVWSKQISSFRFVNLYLNRLIAYLSTWT